MLNTLTPRSFMIFNLISLIYSVIQYPPTWVTSNYIRSGNQDLFTTLTGPGTVHVYSFSFSSSLSGIPHLGYGIKSYQGISLTIFRK